MMRKGQRERGASRNVVELKIRRRLKKNAFNMNQMPGN